MTKIDFMTKQLTQVFTYAELSARLAKCQELLNPKDGYIGEKEVYDKIEELQKVIRSHMKQHMQNSDVGDRAMSVISTIHYFRNHEDY